MPILSSEYDGNLRNEMSVWTPAEWKIYEAMCVVEGSGASLHLTHATKLLSQARQAVAKHVLNDAEEPSMKARLMNTISISEAIRALEAGKKVARSGWNGKGMYLELIPGGSLHLTENLYPMSPCIGLKTSSGNMQPGWNASTPDLFALDWQIITD